MNHWKKHNLSFGLSSQFHQSRKSCYRQQPIWNISQPSSSQPNIFLETEFCSHHQNYYHNWTSSWYQLSKGNLCFHNQFKINIKYGPMLAWAINARNIYLKLRTSKKDLVQMNNARSHSVQTPNVCKSSTEHVWLQKTSAVSVKTIFLLHVHTMAAPILVDYETLLVTWT